MRQKILLVLSLWLGLQASAVASAEQSPAKVVQHFIDAHLQGRFAQARSLTLEQANLSASLFSGWLFATGGGANAPTADVFLSRKFTQTFRYRIIGTTRSGDNQVRVTVMRTSPSLVHMYTWALAPKRGAPPYELIEAIDTYLTKVNFPIEESRMQFTLIREVGDWSISVIEDEKFLQWRQQAMNPQPPSAAVSSPGTHLPGQTALAPAARPVPTTTSRDAGRQMADAQFNATLQSFNYASRPSATSSTPPPSEVEDKPPLLTRVARAFGLGGGKEKTVAKVPDKRLKRTFDNIRDALVRYTASHDEWIPDEGEIYDWQSLRRVVNDNGKVPLPATEKAAGFRFMSYRADPGDGDYTLLVELYESQDGVTRIEVTPYGTDHVN